MAVEIKKPNNRVEPSISGGFIAFWRERMVFENGRAKKFETEEEARNSSRAAMQPAKSFIEPIPVARLALTTNGTNETAAFPRNIRLPRLNYAPKTSPILPRSATQNPAKRTSADR